MELHAYMHRGQEEASRSRGNQEHEPALASLKGEEECDAEWEKGRENGRRCPQIRLQAAAQADQRHAAAFSEKKRLESRRRETPVLLISTVVSLKPKSLPPASPRSDSENKEAERERETEMVREDPNKMGVGSILNDLEVAETLVANMTLDEIDDMTSYPAKCKLLRSPSMQ
uniref:Uncharacterized protein n=1 Tax=Oryza glumipatula TaxID=40148 RepID=A0A0E0BHS4_9ORYZ